MEVYTKQITKVYTPDVLVCGIGPAGLTAAVAAARGGASVMAVEKCAFAGGNITNAYVAGICSAVDNLSGELICGGITLEMMKLSAYQRIENCGRKPIPEMLEEKEEQKRNSLKPRQGLEYIDKAESVRLMFEPEDYKREADKILAGSGVRFLYHTMVGDAVVKDGHIESVIIANKDGICCVKPKLVIDCTGDADIAAMSGAPYEVQPPVQPGTMIFVVGGLEYGDDFQSFYESCRKTMAEADKSGRITHYCGPSIGRLRNGVAIFNNTREIYDSTDAASLTAAEANARSDIKLFFDIYSENIPAFKNAYVMQSGPCLGTRESRRIIGEYVLTLEDIVEGKVFDDAIALGGGIVDFHKVGDNGMHQGHHMVRAHGIPYRTLVPKNVDNLLVAGRCHSVSQMGAAVTRMQVTAMMMGEAAGSAAAIALMDNTVPADVNTERLRTTLLGNGAVLTLN